MTNIDSLTAQEMLLCLEIHHCVGVLFRAPV